MNPDATAHVAAAMAAAQRNDIGAAQEELVCLTDAELGELEYTVRRITAVTMDEQAKRRGR